MQEATNEINKMKRLLSIISPMVCIEAHFMSQGSNCKRRSEAGSLLRIRRKITTLRGQVITVEQPPGLLRGSSKTGKRGGPCCGSTVKVRGYAVPLLALADDCHGTNM
jgi:hypothetical protein